MSEALNDSQAFYLLQEGTPAAFDFYYNRFHQPIFANIFKIIQDRTYAQDILHDVFLALWEKKATLRSPSSVPGWLYVVSQNKSLSFLKQKVTSSTILLEDPSIIERIMETPEIDEEFYKRQLQILTEAVDHLPKRKKELFSLCRFEGKSLEYAASHLGISEDSAKDYLKQSTRLIKQYIQEKYPVEMIVMSSIFLLTIR